MSENNCIRNLLKLICLLQNNSTNNNCLEDGCTKPFLGPTINNSCYNTRIVTLYNKNGTIFTANYLDTNNNIQTSSLLRVQSINNNCVTFLILTTENNNYISTKQTITISLNCICAIKCIEDVNIDNL